MKALSHIRHPEAEGREGLMMIQQSPESVNEMAPSVRLPDSRPNASGVTPQNDRMTGFFKIPLLDVM